MKKSEFLAKKSAMEAEKTTPDLEHKGHMKVHYVNKKPYSQYGSMERHKVYKRGESSRIKRARILRDGSRQALRQPVTG